MPNKTRPKTETMIFNHRIKNAPNKPLAISWIIIDTKYLHNIILLNNN